MSDPIRHKYNCQKTHAKIRGIEWHFTFESWLEWWGEDIVNRGPYKGQLVMARYNDIGPYHPDNVYKSTTSDNCRLPQLGKPKSAESIAKAKETKSKRTYIVSAETRAKKSASMKATLAKKKELAL
jgi:hypothetical protein